MAIVLPGVFLSFVARVILPPYSPLLDANHSHLKCCIMKNRYYCLLVIERGHRWRRALYHSDDRLVEER